MENVEKPQIIDISKMARTLWSKKKLFFKVWGITFVLSCIWIFPQPRYYTSEVKLAPEMSGEDVGGGLSSIASSFGFNIGGVGGQDAIYPELYPELFESPEFIVGLYDIQVTTKDGDLTVDYYTYIKNHQKKNVLLAPYYKLTRWVQDHIDPDDSVVDGVSGDKKINPFVMSRRDYDLMQIIIDLIHCSVDTKTSVISIKVTDQDPLVCATMADSVKEHLQAFITRYRTSKASDDVIHYQQMCDSAEYEYDKAMNAYSLFCDTHKDVILQRFQSERDKLEKDLSLKQNALNALETQLQTTKVKLQEKTPSFTTLKSAIVPVKPSGPKRLLFVLCMLFLSTIITMCCVLRADLKKFVIISGNK